MVPTDGYLRSELKIAVSLVEDGYFFIYSTRIPITIANTVKTIIIIS